MNKIVKLAAIALSGLLLTNQARATGDDQSLRDYLATMTGFTAKFAQTVYDEQQQVLQRSSGEVAIKRPGKLRWQVEMPDEELLIANDDVLWLYSPFLEQVSIYSLSDAIGQSPFMLLTSDDPSVWNDYQITSNDAGYKIVSNTPTTVAWLQVNISAEQIRSIDMQDTAGKVTRFELSDFKAGAPAGEQLFQFDIPEGVEVDDQRSAG